VYAGEVSKAAVSAFEDHTAAHRCFNGDKNIIAVNGDDLTGEGFDFDSALGTRFKLLGGAGATHDSEPLPFPQRESIADQFQRAFLRVTLTQQQAVIHNRSPQIADSISRKQLLIFRMRPSVTSLIGHGSSLVSGGS
jgi:hypothetical protein